jgi:beta-galactosidase
VVLVFVSSMVHAQPLYFGTSWYPEQWPEDRWETDLELMQAAHINVVRIGEFAWSTMEPSEGHFDFVWLDKAIALAAKHHIAVVLGTPTAAPPAWLTSKYPETLRVDENGRHAEHGNRQHFSFADPKYRYFARTVALEMAKRYGHHPNVIGWQIDNEIAVPSFDEAAQAQFHAWLQHRYGTIGELNRRWATAYWSQTYDDFSQIPVRATGENPALLLDWKRFVSETWASYLRNQLDVIRANSDRQQWITTNSMHWFNGYDHYVVHRELDLAAWDDYVPDGHLNPDLNAAQHDLVRGYKQKNFWLMESQPGFVNWGPVNVTLPPGVTREMAWQAVGHGADAVLYWQWRSALNGQEQYHGTIVGADGTPVPIYGEIQQIGEEFGRIGPVLDGTVVHAPVAILNSYESHWAIDFQKHTQKYDYVATLVDLYRAIRPIAQSVDIVSPDVPLRSYKVVFAPSLNVISKATADHLLDYVRNGGHLVLGPRSGMKDVDNALQSNRQPGPLEDALGGRVEQFYALDQSVPVMGTWGTGKASVWAEQLSAQASGAKVLMTYGRSNGWLDGQPAVMTRKYGKGDITYVGALLDEALTHSMVETRLAEAGVSPVLPGLPDGVELMPRDGANGLIVWILTNHNQTPVKIDPLRDGIELLTQTKLHSRGQKIELPAHGVAVYELAGAQ